MNKVIHQFSPSMVLCLRPFRLTNNNCFSMSLLTDKLTERQNKKAQDEFKREIEYMANKPTFTYMDYKQRVTDQLNNLKSSIKKNMSQQAKQAEKSLTIEKKILNALYEEELLGQNRLRIAAKKQISIVSEVPIEKVRETLKKADSYKKMHKLLREKLLKGEPLPESMTQLQYQFRNSRHQLAGKERMYLRFRQERGCAGYLRATRARYLKFKK